MQTNLELCDIVIDLRGLDDYFMLDSEIKQGKQGYISFPRDQSTCELGTPLALMIACLYCARQLGKVNMYIPFGKLREFCSLNGRYKTQRRNWHYRYLQEYNDIVRPALEKRGLKPIMEIKQPLGARICLDNNAHFSLPLNICLQHKQKVEEIVQSYRDLPPPSPCPEEELCQKIDQCRKSVKLADQVETVFYTLQLCQLSEDIRAVFDYVALGMLGFDRLLEYAKKHRNFGGAEGAEVLRAAIRWFPAIAATYSDYPERERMLNFVEDCCGVVCRKLHEKFPPEGHGSEFWNSFANAWGEDCASCLRKLITEWGKKL